MGNINHLVRDEMDGEYQLPGKRQREERDGG
jgi:hypothetical protein